MKWYKNLKLRDDIKKKILWRQVLNAVSEPSAWIKNLYKFHDLFIIILGNIKGKRFFNIKEKGSF